MSFKVAPKHRGGRRALRAVVALSSAAAIAATLVACTPSSPAPEGSTSPASPGGTADIAAAEAMIAPFIGAPTEFPITEPLKSDPAGKKIAFMDCGTPVCALYWDITSAAASELGIEMVRLDAGGTAETVDTAFTTAASGGFDGVIVVAITASLWQRQAAELAANHIPIVSTGLTGVDRSLVEVAQISEDRLKRDGELMAAYIVATYGADSDVVMYETPELPFSTLLTDAFMTEMGELCNSCAIRREIIPISAYGSGAPSIVVDDFQSHPSTSIAAFSVGESANGLIPAMKVAGMDKNLVYYVPSPENLGDIRNGDADTGLALDFGVIGWTLIDSLARMMTGQAPDPGAVNDLSPTQFLRPADVPSDVSAGWSAYPDFADRFMALWKNAS